MIRIKSVMPQSIGAELGLEEGTELLSVDGRPLGDFLDWEFLTAEDRFLLLARTPRGEEIEFDIERPEGASLGVELEPPRIRRCANRCDFCFVDGLPEGLRDNLYIRDDDYRLSFRYGNFATLTNLKESDVARILEYRLSPLYVSVHATDPSVRRRLLRNPLAPDVIEQLSHLSAGGIRFHTQIVLQPGVNDGEVLQQSLDDLYRLGDPILSCSVVPVGLTEFSKHHLVREPTKEDCARAIEILSGTAARARREREFDWVMGSDELYLRAGVELPSADTYGDFEQVENGVGSVRFLESRIDAERHRFPDLAGRRVGVLTGTAMQRIMEPVLKPLASATGADLELLVLTNRLFGPRVSTAGLLPGADFREALATRPDLDLALIPAESLNDQLRFIDDVRWDELTARTPCEIRYSYDFVDALAGENPR